MRVKVIERCSSKDERPIYIVQQDEYLLSVKEVGERLNLGINAVRKLIKKGELDYLEVTVEKKVLNSSVNEFIRRNKNKDSRELLRD
ncbi:hypothetical protein [Peptacetobacter sp.]|uniref:hypothetical protein n=1 Tax=Peptacetobacter sp. TaxID=2991975 RepID=UPI002E79120D|nr:hypothetical protein [Peptacetobacter sp.]MEE0451943.1 hypothetical protein [Peptacetobacter sp.]